MRVAQYGQRAVEGMRAVFRAPEGGGRFVEDEHVAGADLLGQADDRPIRAEDMVVEPLEGPVPVRVFEARREAADLRRRLENRHAMATAREIIGGSQAGES